MVFRGLDCAFRVSAHDVQQGLSIQSFTGWDCTQCGGWNPGDVVDRVGLPGMVVPANAFEFQTRKSDRFKGLKNRCYSDI
jgi:hypothetical protein